jgi:membrane fusion protein (multidrug efflux system)
VKVGGVSRQVYDDTVAALAQAKADVAVAKANLATAKINLDYTKVFSPISGRIGKSSVTEGALVTANQTTALAVVQNLDRIYVDVNQSSEELMALKKGLNNPEQNSMVNLFIGKEGSPYDLKGKLLFSDATVDQSTGMVQLRILFPNPEKELLPGLFVRARVEQSRQDKAIVVPQQAVVRNSDGSVSVWVVGKDNIVKYQTVNVSQAIKDQWVVSAGLAPGDRIVVEGLQKISPQAKVSTVEYKASTNS